ncbi:hypothetical protein QAD02_008191 [Eretmocerus hayati]|uniref:Uncharacterized protein n=1 Tax=Eretmocerus hayati TaxID=131215 RepID=A0ACC2N866_9HYME|nr:hypothetical protein QAD02_008191 [Eretmocerus hayati]
MTPQHDCVDSHQSDLVHDYDQWAHYVVAGTPTRSLAPPRPAPAQHKVAGWFQAVLVAFDQHSSPHSGVEAAEGVLYSLALVMLEWQGACSLTYVPVEMGPRQRGGPDRPVREGGLHYRSVVVPHN